MSITIASIGATLTLVLSIVLALSLALALALHEEPPGELWHLIFIFMVTTLHQSLSITETLCTSLKFHL